MNKKGEVGTVIKIMIVILFIALIILVGYYVFNSPKTPESGQQTTTKKVSINPALQLITQRNTNPNTNESLLVEQGIKMFNESYINYLLSSLGTSKLHRALVSYGNPKLELIIDNEVWSTEISDSGFVTQKTPSDDPDLRIRLSKEDAVKAILSNDSKQYMKDLLSNGKVQLEMVAGKVELYSKGYLDMAKELGYEIKL